MNFTIRRYKPIALFGKIYTIIEWHETPFEFKINSYTVLINDTSKKSDYFIAPIKMGISKEAAKYIENESTMLEEVFFIHQNTFLSNFEDNGYDSFNRSEIKMEHIGEGFEKVQYSKAFEKFREDFITRNISTELKNHINSIPCFPIHYDNSEI